MKWFIAAILTLSSALAMAQGSDELWVTELDKFIKTIGVTVSYNDKEVCQDDTLAAWHNVENRYIFCSNALGQLPHSEKMNAIKHETIHMIQDCKAGLNNDYSTYLISPIHHPTLFRVLRQQDREFISNGYKEIDRPFEIEAYYLQNFDFGIIMDLAYEYCR